MKLKLLIFIILYSLRLSAQTEGEPIIKFNKTYEEFNDPQIDNVYEVEDGYVMLGAMEHEAPNNYGIAIIHTDFEGNITWEKSITDTVYTYYRGGTGGVFFKLYSITSYRHKPM